MFACFSITKNLNTVSKNICLIGMVEHAVFFLLFAFLYLSARSFPLLKIKYPIVLYFCLVPH